jgi:hypothetical protein
MLPNCFQDAWLPADARKYFPEGKAPPGAKAALDGKAGCVSIRAAKTRRHLSKSDPRTPKSLERQLRAFYFRPFRSPQFQGDLRHAFAVGPQHHKDAITQAHRSTLPTSIHRWTGSACGLDDRNQDADQLNHFSLIFCELYAYLEEVIR